MTVTRADNASGRIAAAHPRPFIPIPSKGGVEFGFKKLFDEAPNARAHPGFQGIEPIIAEKLFAFGGPDRRLCAIHCHGVISIGALTPILVCFHKLEITPPSNSNHLRDGTIRKDHALYAKREALDCHRAARWVWVWNH
jgi:hypothetical protein